MAESLDDRLRLVAAQARVRALTWYKHFIFDPNGECGSPANFRALSETCAFLSYVEDCGGVADQLDGFDWNKWWCILLGGTLRRLGHYIKGLTTYSGSRRRRVHTSLHELVEQEDEHAWTQFLKAEGTDHAAVDETIDQLRQRLKPSDFYVLWQFHVLGRSQLDLAADLVSLGRYPDTPEGRHRAGTYVHVAAHRARQRARAILGDRKAVGVAA
jgi:hypothetical protein